MAHHSVGQVAVQTDSAARERDCASRVARWRYARRLHGSELESGPKTGTRGTTTNNHALILGVWATLVIGLWGSGFELIVDPFRLKKQGMIELTTFMLGDVALKYPAAFVVAECQPS